MEHITITELPNGLFKLTPDQGFMLMNSATQMLYSEAIVKEREINRFVAVAVDNG